MPTNKVTLNLPWPPSVNHYWRHTKNRHYISKEGSQYCKIVGSSCFSFKKSFDESKRLAVNIKAFPPDRRKRDLDNLLKGLLDAIQKAGIYIDDNQIDMLSISRNSPLTGRVIVEIAAID